MPYVSRGYLEHISAEKRADLVRFNIPVGYHPETGDELLLPDRDRYAGTYMLGVQGTGKTALLEHLIAYDCKVGNAIIVIDAHGDLTTHCIAELPQRRIAEASLLDMEDEAYPFGVNVFATNKLTTSVAHAQAVNRIMHIFEVLWDEVVSQQYLPRYVRAATITFLANPGATLVDMHTFLLNQQFRHTMLANVSDPSVRQFWETQYDDLSTAEKYRRVQPLIGRLESLFMGRSLVRNIVGQRRTTINFRKAIENREIVFIKLPVKTVSQDARLIGTVIVSQLHAAIFSFADIPEQQRPGVSLYVDEFQHFATPDFAEMFTEGRKFGVKVTLAHQYRGQLPSYLRESTMTARTKICFQTTPEDGREMAHLFPSQETTIKPEDINAHPVEYLLTYGVDNPFVRELVDTYLLPLQGQRRGQRVEIWDTGFSVTDTIFDMVNGGRVPNPRVQDPTPYLDNLLYQVMRTGDAHLPIPPEAVIGFSNCGRSFFQVVRGGVGDLLVSSLGYPPALVVQTADGYHWTRRPENGLEQLYHLIFHLRMTMLHLAEFPIGKQIQANPTAVGQMLANLPKRAAFVRSGSDVGVFYTHDTPKRIKEQELLVRVRGIQAQTRLKYCHPRAEVERMFAATDDPEISVPSEPTKVPQLSRWEEA